MKSVPCCCYTTMPFTAWLLQPSFPMPLLYHCHRTAQRTPSRRIPRTRRALRTAPLLRMYAVCRVRARRGARIAVVPLALPSRTFAARFAVRWRAFCVPPYAAAAALPAYHRAAFSLCILCLCHAATPRFPVPYCRCFMRTCRTALPPFIVYTIFPAATCTAAPCLPLPLRIYAFLSSSYTLPLLLLPFIYHSTTHLLPLSPPLFTLFIAAYMHYTFRAFISVRAYMPPLLFFTFIYLLVTPLLALTCPCPLVTRTEIIFGLDVAWTSVQDSILEG